LMAMHTTTPPPPPSSPSSPSSPNTVVLLVTLFHPGKDGGKNAHIGELFAATGVNLQNPHFSEVHVLFEHPSPMCSTLPDLLRGTVPDLTVEDLAKLTCVDTRKRPTYADLFAYANGSLKWKVVALANTDIVFDETIGLVDGPELLRSGQALVLGVKLPKHRGLYKKVFGHECDTRSAAHPVARCYLGEVDGEGASVGMSWDVFVFASPMPPPKKGRGVKGLDFFTSVMHAENAVGYALEVEHGLAVANACLEVHAWHWHCQGTKMHAKSEGSIKMSHRGLLYEVWPCSDCPAVRKPPGEVSRPQQCAAGHRANMKAKSLAGLFSDPKLVEICCKNAKCDEKAILEAWRHGGFPPCRRPEDVDCYMASWKPEHDIRK